MKLITTSWDDGHPLDFRIAELLDKYRLKGTFYIPQKNTGHSIVNEKEISVLSNNFEIGGHTLNHLNLTTISNTVVQKEVLGCYHWIREITQTAPVSFCPPLGKFSRANLEVAYASGFKLIRTTVMLSPYFKSPLTDTTLQVYDHSKLTFFKHLSKRILLGNLLLWIQAGFTTDTFRLLDHYLDHIESQGGCLHIWGHSWEIEKFKLWQKLEMILAHIANRKEFDYVENRDLLKYS